MAFAVFGLCFVSHNLKCSLSSIFGSCDIFFQCSPDYAYGSGGFPAWGIQPNSVLVFEIEVLGAE